MIRFLFVLLFAFNAHADNVLFVGNSLTGVNNMPGVFRGLAETQALHPSVFVSMKFGKTLADQLADSNVRALVASRKWDAVILQEYSDLPLREPATFEKSVLEFTKLLAGTRVLLFQNWPYSDANSSVLPKLNLVYAKVGRAAGAEVVHLGRAMDHLHRRTEIGMYSDEKHPQPIATYMGAVMMLQAVYGLSPSVLPPRGSATNTGADSLGEAPPAVWIDLDETDARLVQETAIRFK